MPVIDRRGKPLPGGHPFKGGAIIFTSGMPEAYLEMIREYHRKKSKQVGEAQNLQQGAVTDNKDNQ